MSAYRVKRHRNGRQWDVVDSRGVIVEGGFFARDAAQATCDDWNAEHARAARNADRIDGYDRDDLGASPDY